MQNGAVSSLFISHASEDKELVARPLAAELAALGHEVWFDEYLEERSVNIFRSDGCRGGMTSRLFSTTTFKLAEVFTNFILLASTLDWIYSL